MLVSVTEFAPYRAQNTIATEAGGTQEPRLYRIV
jgi:hypothetical protein